MDPAFTPGVVCPPDRATPAEWYLVHEKGVVVLDRPGGVAIPGDADVADLDRGAAQYLGHRGERAVFALSLGQAPPPPGMTLLDLRALFGALGESTFAIAGRAVQIVAWAESHRFCGRCATPTEPVPGERCRRCPACALTAYPRVAPAVIVLVRRGAEALLAQNSRFRGGFFSTLAGFVEAGESLEETVAREILEEVGVEVGALRYFGSQPWPFPHSLMIGFFAEWRAGEPRPDGHEIVDARWFSPGRLPLLPPPLSIARRLIDAWLADPAR
jgi:NAD+ diphosphatase